ncbi:MAG: hypothetical protein ACFFCV_04265 [Promethearchaeota archaeon]
MILIALNYVFGLILSYSYQRGFISSSFVIAFNILLEIMIIFSVGIIFLYVSMLYRPKVMLKNTNQILFFVTFGILMLVLFFIPNGVQLEVGTDYSTNLPYFTYSLIILILLFISSNIMSIKIFNRLNNSILRKKYKFFWIGIILIFFHPLLLTIIRFINSPILELILFIVALFLLFGVLFIYYGLGVNIKDA